MSRECAAGGGKGGMGPGKSSREQMDSGPQQRRSHALYRLYVDNRRLLSYVDRRRLLSYVLRRRLLS